MNGREARRYSMFGRVVAFGKVNAADFEPDSEGALRFAALTRITHEAEIAAAGHGAGLATAKRKVFDSLRADMRNVARSARAIARREPGFADKFRVPNSSGHTQLMTAVDAMLVELYWPDIAAKFIAHELPVDFVQRLADGRRALAEAQDDLERDDAESIARTAAFKRLIREGMDEVAYLDAIVRNKYHGKLGHLQVWRRARRPERARRRSRKAAGATSARKAATGHTDGSGSQPGAAETAKIGK